MHVCALCKYSLQIIVLKYVWNLRRHVISDVVSLKEKIFAFIVDNKCQTFNWSKLPVNKIFGKNNIWTKVAKTHEKDVKSPIGRAQD